MKSLPLFVACSLLSLAANQAAEREKVLEPRMLEAFQGFGLPDSQGATWVRMTGGDMGTFFHSDLPSNQYGTYTGNAWLVREWPDASVELIVGETRRIRVRKAQAEGDRNVARPTGMRPAEAFISPANLHHDLAALERELELIGRDTGTAKVPENERRHISQNEQGETLLFLAHLQRQGRQSTVKVLLSKLIAAGGDSAAMLKEATSRLAQSRLEEVSTRWTESGDLRAYLAALERLAELFPRESNAEEGAARIAEKARAQLAARAPALDAEAQEAARVLFLLRPEHLVQIPVRCNWLLPGASYNVFTLQGVDMAFIGCPLPELPDLTWTEHEQMAASLLPKPVLPSFRPIRDFFLRRAPAAAALCELLDDHRLLRVLHSNAAPFEVGELAWELVGSLAPNAEFSPVKEEDRDDLKQKLRNLATASSQQIAEAFLKNGDRTRQVMEFAAEHPSPVLLELLRKEYLDRSAWDSEKLDSLRKFVLTLGPQGDSFVDELMTILRPAPAAASPDSESPKPFPPEQLELVELALRPANLTSLLAKLGSSDDASAPKLMRAVMLALGHEFDENTEAQLLHAATEATSPLAKRFLISFFNPSLEVDADFGYSRPQKRGVRFAHPETRHSLALLLSDVTVLPRKKADYDDVPRTVADGIAAGLDENWDQLCKVDHVAAIRWRKAAEDALEANRPLPTLPKSRSRSSK